MYTGQRCNLLSIINLCVSEIQRSLAAAPTSLSGLLPVTQTHTPLSMTLSVLPDQLLI